ncbi:23S rRNA (adenine(2030)-N(6))-methyltransferase RlmJ [Zoogloea dura]|jgi:23S rRNA (adenine2030-N6)-methyltransferase|uniref:Ribosomal RNA large subunit methyltransferase J n=1 Tax=Zoogloea dura TaxID=2728840 RepID=A0A848G022_9RHOO|nr:23S rRNA (adenine(2030)-N(6))-methyltransferase RlmJ [Zoogloea dura]NML24446.1 23S rRNA (adenine(2030)-N(6))-methyltransferase RlmJ [Zoogloea dura]
MLSYRHAFHAGNHADVLKHFVLVQLLEYFNQKDKPYWYIDTHAGAGCYSLDEAFARKNAEFEDGVGRLLGRKDVPKPLKSYLKLVRELNDTGKLKLYPGSPCCAAPLLRTDDRMRLFELHPADNRLLRQTFDEAHGKAIVLEQDGFTGINAFLPPPSRRALVLIDPPYEVKSDYRTVVSSLKECLRRFPTGTYVVWYPRLQTMLSRELPDKLKRLPITSWLNVSLDVSKPSEDGYGMHGSGLFVINPPWTLPDTLKTVMPWLVQVLGLDDGAAFGLEYEIP